MIKNLDKLVGLNNVELLSIIEHPHKKGEDLVISVGDISGYEFVTYDTHERAILFMKKMPNGLLDITFRVQKERFIGIREIDGIVKIFVD